jgi:zinc-ribbon domain
MYCEQCGTLLRAGVRFCPDCGAGVVASSVQRTPGAGGTRFAITVGQIFGVVGGIVLLVSIFLRWLDFSRFPGGLTLSASDTSLDFLVDYNVGMFQDPSLLALLIPAVVLSFAGVAFHRVRWLTVAGGAIGIVVAVLFAFQMNQSGISDSRGIGPIVAFIGGALAVAGVLHPRAWRLNRRPARMRSA